MLSLLVLLASLVAAHTLVQRPFYAQEDAEHHFNQFITTFNKNYESKDERNFRFNIFKENLKTINEQNAMAHAVFGVTEFTDKTMEGFEQKLTRSRNDPDPDDVICKNITVQGTSTPPDSLDWRDKGIVSKVKNEHYCWAGWAFSIAGNVEGQYALKYGASKFVELSAQQFIDCDEFDDGCDSGDPDMGMTWQTLSKNGSMSEKDYPYVAKDNKECRYDPSKAIVQVTGCNRYVNVTEDQLKQILADVGPLSIMIPYGYILNYFGGICECTPQISNLTKYYNPPKGLLLVGYGKENDKPYWIVKNSWSDRYGEKGYIRLAMYKNWDKCGLLDNIVSATIA